MQDSDKTFLNVHIQEKTILFFGYSFKWLGRNLIENHNPIHFQIFNSPVYALKQNPLWHKEE